MTLAILLLRWLDTKVAIITYLLAELGNLRIKVKKLLRLSRIFQSGKFNKPKLRSRRIEIVIVELAAVLFNFQVVLSASGCMEVNSELVATHIGERYLL